MRVLIDNVFVYKTEDESFSEGSVALCDGIIGDVFSGRNRADGEYDFTLDGRGALALPGFVDIHTHGRAGFDFVSADHDGLMTAAESYLSRGTTTLMPTLASAPLDELLSACDRINDAAKSVPVNFAGIHLEGRYLNPAKRGAHAPELLAPLDADELAGLIERMRLPCRVTAALELDRDGSFAERAKALGTRLSLGHTCADYAQATGLYKKYGVGFSHLWNAMPTLHHRDGGAVGAAFDCDAYCEVICDGMHIAPEIIRLTYRETGAKRFALITDSLEAAGCPDGEYSIAGQPCTVKNGRAMTHDGALAGSTLDMKAATENLMSFCGLSLGKALRSATLTPAEAAGIDKSVGSLEHGKRADILLCGLDGKKLNIGKIICGGVPFGGIDS